LNVAFDYLEHFFDIAGSDYSFSTSRDYGWAVFGDDPLAGNDDPRLAICNGILAATDMIVPLLEADEKDNGCSICNNPRCDSPNAKH
jgi:hypothetical protein